jgi:DNA-binding GntR family transcriptional regulator
MATPKFAKIERTSVASQVYDDIRQSILNGSLLPGTHLAEPQIASQMGVSRSPVREAIQRLEANGLITIHPSQGAFVRGLSADEVQDIYTARILIEGHMAELAAQRASRADAKALRQAVAKVDEVGHKEDYQATIEADFALHRLVWEIAEHPILFDVLTRLEDQIRMFMAVQAPLFEHLYDSVESHHQFVEAIIAGDADAAKTTIQQHIEEAGTLAVAKLSRAGEGARSSQARGHSERSATLFRTNEEE